MACCGDCGYRRGNCRYMSNVPMKVFSQYVPEYVYTDGAPWTYDGGVPSATGCRNSNMGSLVPPCPEKWGPRNTMEAGNGGFMACSMTNPYTGEWAADMQPPCRSMAF